MDFYTLYAFDTREWDSLGRQFHTLSVDYGSLRDTLTKRGSGPVSEAYTNPSGPLAVGKIDEAGGSFMVLCTLLDAASSVASTYASAMNSLRDELHDAVAVATGSGLAVDTSTGGVWFASTPTTPEDMSGRLQAAGWARSQFALLLGQADTVDSDAQNGMWWVQQGLSQDDASVNACDPYHTPDPMDGAGVIATNDDLAMMRAALPIGATPAQIQAWWDDLDPTSRRQFELAVPVDVYDLLSRIPAGSRQADVMTALDDMTGLSTNGYNSVETVAWAQNNYNINPNDLPFHDMNGDANCTIFVSTALHRGGGLPYDGSSWYAEGLRYPSHSSGASNSFGVACENAAFFQSHGTTLATTANGDSPPFGSVKPGDIADFTKNSAVDGVPFHAAIVTAVLPNGDILYTQQGPMLNGDLNIRSQRIVEDDGDFTTTFVRPRKDW